MEKRSDTHSTATAVGYVRVSKKKQELSPLDQRDKFADWSAHNAIPILEIFEDKQCGEDSIENRPGLDGAVKFIKQLKVDFLLVTKRDRASRGVENMVILEAQLRKLDPPCRILTVVDDPLEQLTPAARFTQRILDAYAEMELEQIRERTKTNIKKARQLGRFSGPKGWETFTRGQRTIQLVKELAKRGMGNVAILAYLEGHGLLTPHRGQFTLAHVRKCLESSYREADLDQTPAVLLQLVSSAPYYKSKFVKFVPGDDTDRKRQHG